MAPPCAHWGRLPHGHLRRNYGGATRRFFSGKFRRNGVFLQKICNPSLFYETFVQHFVVLRRMCAKRRCFMENVCKTTFFYGGCVQNDVVLQWMCAKRRCFIENVCKTTLFYRECMQNDFVLRRMCAKYRCFTEDIKTAVTSATAAKFPNLLGIWNFSENRWGDFGRLTWYTTSVPRKRVTHLLLSVIGIPGFYQLQRSLLRLWDYGLSQS